MATPRTRNLRLFLSNGLSVEARANLEIIDRLGDVYYVDNTDSVNIRSKTNINLLPADPNVGGTGQADVSIGSLNNRVSNFSIYADNFLMSGTLSLKDAVPYTGAIASDLRKSLVIQYKSANAYVDADTAADRTLSIDPQGGDRTLTLAQNLELAGGHATKLNVTAPTDLILPSTGTIATLAGTEVLTNKSIDADANLLSNIKNADIKANAAIAYSKLNLSNAIQNSDVSPSAAIAYSKLNLAGSITNADVSPSAAIAAEKIAIAPSGTLLADNVEDALYELQAEIDTKADDAEFDAHVAATRAHGIQSGSAIVGTTDAQTLSNKTLNSPVINTPSGLSKSDVGLGNVDNYSAAQLAALSETLTNKIISGNSNTLQNIAYSSLVLTDSIVNADVDTNAAIAGTKINADFGPQSVSTQVSVKIGVTEQIELAPPTGGFTSSYTLKLPPAQATAADQSLVYDGAGGLKWFAAAGSGTVTSVGLTVPSNLLTVTGSPINTAGTFAIALPNQSPNTVFAGPATGLSNEPAFRALVAADLPAHTHASTDITDFVTAVNDRVDTLIADSTNVTWTYTPNLNPALSTLSAAINFTGLNTGNLAEGSNLYFTSDRVYTASKAQLVADTGITITSNDLAKTLTISVDQADISTDNITEGTTNLFFTDERAQDAVANLIINSNDIAKTYDDLGNSFQLSLRTEAITSKAQKASPTGTDQLLLSDTADSGALKRISLQSILELSGGSFAETWLPAAGLTKTVTHNLNSKDVLIQLYDVDTGETVWLDSMKRDSVNTVLLTASELPPTNGWRVLIKRI